MTQWSIKHGVEIIDLSEDPEQDDVEQVFAANGQKRVIEALQTVLWTQWCTVQDPEASEKDVEDFETLFANLVHFKETAAGLPDEERRKFAEKVALSFYSALGDDDESD